ncbi:1481_t:CDS:1, partial [Dentiscutata erythropus]
MRDALREHFYYLIKSSAIPILLDLSTKFETFNDEGDQNLATAEIRVIFSQYKLNQPDTVPQIEDPLKFFHQILSGKKDKNEP